MKPEAKKQIKDGICKLYYADGTVASIGKNKNGKHEGIWEHYYKSGKLWATGKFKDGKFIGMWKWYYKDDGKLMQTGSFKDSKQVGQWKRYDHKGKVYNVITYKDGKRVKTEKVSKPKK